VRCRPRGANPGLNLSVAFTQPASRACVQQDAKGPAPHKPWSSCQTIGNCVRSLTMVSQGRGTL